MTFSRCTFRQRKFQFLEKEIGIVKGLYLSLLYEFFNRDTLFFFCSNCEFRRTLDFCSIVREIGGCIGSRLTPLSNAPLWNVPYAPVITPMRC